MGSRADAPFSRSPGISPWLCSAVCCCSSRSAGCRTAWIAASWRGSWRSLSLLPRMGNGEPIRYTGAFDAMLSPDGQWLLFSSSVVRPEVFVQSVPPERGGKWQISTAGGELQIWRRDGKELFYRYGATFFAVDVKTDGASFEVGIPIPLFETAAVSNSSVTRGTPYVVTRDGQHSWFSQQLRRWPMSPSTSSSTGDSS